MTELDKDLLHERINIRGEIENIRAVLGEREKLYNERFEQNAVATSLAMTELQRRLDVLNHAHEQAREKEQSFLSKESYQLAHNQLVDDVKKLSELMPGFVRIDKWDDKIKADEEKFKREAEARETALQRVNEKFEEYVKRYEARQREVDLLLTAQKAAAEAAQKAAEDEGRRIREQAADQGRKQSRNLVIVGILLTAIIAIANFIAPHVGNSNPAPTTTITVPK